MLDDFRIYDRALQPEEVVSIYKGDLEEDSFLGGDDPSISFFWGNEDAGMTTSIDKNDSASWDNKIELGIQSMGEAREKGIDIFRDVG